MSMLCLTRRTLSCTFAGSGETCPLCPVAFEHGLSQHRLLVLLRTPLLIHIPPFNSAIMGRYPRTRGRREKSVDVEQSTNDLEEKIKMRASKLMPLDEQIKNLACQPGVTVALREHIAELRRRDPCLPSKTEREFPDAARLRNLLIRRWGPYDWEDKVVSAPKPDKTSGKGPADKHVAFEDSDSGSSHTLGHEPGPSTWVCSHRLQEMARERAEEEELKAAIIKSQAAMLKDEIASKQAGQELQHRPTLNALNNVLRVYPGEEDDIAAWSERIHLAILHLRGMKRAHVANETSRAHSINIRAAIAKQEAIPRRPLTDSEVLSVQQMWRAMNRPQHQVETTMKKAVQDFIKQFPEAGKFSPVQLANRPGMLPAIVKAIRKANDAELEKDKKELTASREASLEQIWKPTGAALFVRVPPGDEAEPRTPIHQTRSGALPPTPTAPKKAATKKMTPKKVSPKKVVPWKAVSSPAKPIGVKKSATPTTQRKSTRLSAKDH
jgi:hypothetical protein